jgi:DNA-binding FrmR family transcriptional regulator
LIAGGVGVGVCRVSARVGFRIGLRFGRLRGCNAGSQGKSEGQAAERASRAEAEKAWAEEPKHGKTSLFVCEAQENRHRMKAQLYPHRVDTIPGMGIVKRREAMSQHDRERLKLLQRVRKMRGQLDAVEKALGVDEDCGDQLMLLAAVRGGVNGLMGEILEDHIRFHLVDGAKEQIAPELAEDLIDLVRAYLK